MTPLHKHHNFEHGYDTEVKLWLNLELCRINLLHSTIQSPGKTDSRIRYLFELGSQ